MVQNSTPRRTKAHEVGPADLDAALRITRQQIRKYPNRELEKRVDDIAGKALKELHRAMGREHIHNHEGFMSWKIRNLIFDALRKRKTEEAHLKVLANEIEVVRGKRIHDDYVQNNGRFSMRGLTADIISREEQELVNLIGLAIIEIMPDPADRQILNDRFSDDFTTITDLADKYGKTPNSMANHLKKILGSERESGAVSPVRHVLQELSHRTGVEFVREITRLDATETISNPIGAAIAHLDLAATRSRAHQQQAARATAHLRWLEANMPSNRGLPNKVLVRLIRAACFYVIEPNDARHDSYSEVGLHDDVAVVKAVQRAVSKYSK